VYSFKQSSLSIPTKDAARDIIYIKNKNQNYNAKIYSRTRDATEHLARKREYISYS
jgi:hypothetical protein